MALRVRLKRLGLSVGSTVLCLTLAEIALRVAGVVPPRWARSRHLEREDKRVGLDAYPTNPRGYFDIDLRDPAVRARWRDRGLTGVDRAAEGTPFAVAFEYNELLCRGGAVAPRDPEVSRIVMVGDSFTEGQGVRQGDTFASVLGRELDGSVEVINCGRRGHDFPMIREYFDRILALEPDVVVYAMVLNDPVRSEAFHARQAYLDDWIMDRRRMVAEGRAWEPAFWEPRLYALAHDALEGVRVGRETTRWYLDMYEEPNREGWEATLGHIAHMRTAMGAREGDFLVVLLPLLIDLQGSYPFADLSRTIADALASRGVAFHDVTPTFLGRDPTALWVHRGDRHPNELGHRIIADELRPPLQAIIDRRRERTSRGGS